MDPTDPGRLHNRIYLQKQAKKFLKIKPELLNSLKESDELFEPEMPEQLPAIALKSRIIKPVSTFWNYFKKKVAHYFGLPFDKAEALKLYGAVDNASDAMRSWKLVPSNLVKQKAHFSFKNDRKDTLNNSTKAYDCVMDYGPGKTPYDLEWIIVVRNKANHHAKESYDYAFRVNATLHDLGANVAEPLFLVNDVYGDETQIRKELTNLLSDEQIDSIVEDLLKRSCAKEAIITKRLMGPRTDKELAWMEHQIRSIQSKVDKKNRRRETVKKEMVKELKNAERFAISRHLESIIENNALGTFYEDSFIEHGVELKKVSLKEYLETQCSEAIRRLEHSELKRHNPTINLANLYSKLTVKSNVSGLADVLSNLINSKQFLGFSHGEATVHHFIPDKDGTPKCFDFDKSKTNFFVFYDVLTFLNNQVAKTYHGDRGISRYDAEIDLFLRSVIYFGKLQLEHRSESQKPILDFNNNTYEFMYEALKDFRIIESPRIGSSKPNLSYITLPTHISNIPTRVSLSTAEKLSFFNSKQISSLLAIYDLYSGIHNLVIAGRASKFSGSQEGAFNSLDSNGYDDPNLQGYWFDEYVDHSTTAKQKISNWDSHFTSESDGARGFIKSPHQISMKSLYDAGKTRRQCARNMYKSLERAKKRLEIVEYYSEDQQTKLEEDISLLSLQSIDDAKPSSNPIDELNDFKSYMSTLVVERTVDKSLLTYIIPFFNLDKKY